MGFPPIGCVRLILLINEFNYTKVKNILLLITQKVIFSFSNSSRRLKPENWALFQNLTHETIEDEKSF